MAQINNIDEMLTGIAFIKNEENEKAEKIFWQIIYNAGFKTLEEINNLVKNLALEKQPTILTLDTQKALLGLGLVYAKGGMTQEAKDCILNAAYRCYEGSVLFLAGTFYLTFFDAELNMSLAYFEIACKVNPQWVWRCDESVQWFMNNRMVFYPFFEIIPYKLFWDEIKQEITRSTDIVAIKDVFTERFLEVLMVFGEKETKRLRDFLTTSL